MWLLQQYNINLSSHLGEKWEDKSLEGIFSAGGKFSSWLKAERGGCGRCTPGSDGTRRGTGGGLRFWEDQHQLSATVTQNLSQISGASIFTRSPAVLPSLTHLIPSLFSIFWDLRKWTRNLNSSTDGKQIGESHLISHHCGRCPGNICRALRNFCIIVPSRQRAWVTGRAHVTLSLPLSPWFSSLLPASAASRGALSQSNRPTLHANRPPWIDYPQKFTHSNFSSLISPFWNAPWIC